MRESPFVGLRNRVLQHLAMTLPGATSVRVKLNRWRGVEIGEGVWIGYEALLETADPQFIHIGNRVSIGIRTTIIAHFRETHEVWIEDDVFVGPCSCILPGVRLGKGCVVSAGSVVTSSVPPMTVVQGNPARPIAKCGTPLLASTPLRDFVSQLQPIR